MFGHDINHQQTNPVGSSSDPQDDNHQDGQGNDTQPAGFVATPTTNDPIGTAPTPADELIGPPPASASTNDLLDIKHEALQALTPLVGQLDQTPEEQFRTTMMMIQASDDHALVKVAYEAAKKITNEKERAQALLDIVNEINYFTQQA